MKIPPEVQAQLVEAGLSWLLGQVKELTGHEIDAERARALAAELRAVLAVEVPEANLGPAPPADAAIAEGQDEISGEPTEG